MSDEFGLRTSLSDRAPRGAGDGSGPAAWFSPRLILGLAIVALGSLLLLDNLNVIEADPIYRYFFPGVLLAVGISVLVQGSIWGWVWIVGGGWGLAEKLDYVELSFFQLFLPGALLLVLSLIHI